MIISFNTQLTHLFIMIRVDSELRRFNGFFFTNKFKRVFSCNKVEKRLKNTISSIERALFRGKEANY